MPHPLGEPENLIGKAAVILFYDGEQAGAMTSDVDVVQINRPAAPLLSAALERFGKGTPGAREHDLYLESVLKRGLLLFWAAWLSLVFLTNLCDAGKAAGLLPAGWSFASGNYRFVCETTARLGTPAWLNGLLFAGVIGWEGVAATLFWVAGLRRRARQMRYAAFAAGLSLWAAFVLADEVFVAYAIEATHWRLFTAQLATLLAVELLPEGGTQGA